MPFHSIGLVESYRLLLHKNCGFVNFVRLEDAIRARQEMNGTLFFGFVMRIEFTRAPDMLNRGSIWEEQANDSHSYFLQGKFRTVLYDEHVLKLK
jgi:RNA recognition motif-containing protein